MKKHASTGRFRHISIPPMLKWRRSAASAGFFSLMRPADGSLKRVMPAAGELRRRAQAHVPWRASPGSAGGRFSLATLGRRIRCRWRATARRHGRDARSDGVCGGVGVGGVPGRRRPAGCAARPWTGGSAGGRAHRARASAVHGPFALCDRSIASLVAGRKIARAQLPRPRTGVARLHRRIMPELRGDRWDRRRVHRGPGGRRGHHRRTPAGVRV